MNEALTPGSAAKTATQVKNSPQPKITTEAPGNHSRTRIKSQPAPPQFGFGPLWSKTYTVKLTGVRLEARQVMREWKDNFSKFWPRGNYLYEPLTGLRTGEVTVVESEIGNGLNLSTGMMVVQSDDTSFTLLTAKGHVFAGRVRFSAVDQPGGPVVRVQLLARSADPLVESVMVVIGHDLEDEFWEDTLTSMARYFRARKPTVVAARIKCLDPNIRWKHLTNITFNPFLRAILDPARLISEPPLRAPG